MRERYLDVFDDVWIDNLNGDRYKTGKVTPGGEPDPSIFSTERNREGIQVGTAIVTMVRRRRHASAKGVHHRDLWSRGKLVQLGSDAGPWVGELSSSELDPPIWAWTSNIAGGDESRVSRLAAASGVFPTSYPGVKTSRDDVVVDFDRDVLVRRMERYFDPAVSDATIRREIPGVMEVPGGSTRWRRGRRSSGGDFCPIGSCGTTTGRSMCGGSIGSRPQS